VEFDKETVGLQQKKLLGSEFLVGTTGECSILGGGVVEGEASIHRKDVHMCIIACFDCSNILMNPLFLSLHASRCDTRRANIETRRKDEWHGVRMTRPTRVTEQRTDSTHNDDYSL
jgi:hypothetical protein